MKRLSILIIESDRVLAGIYKDYFTKLGYKVLVTNSAQSGIDEIDVLPPDMILLELQLVEHNGYEFLYEMRSYPEWQYIPVIINSSVPQRTSNLNQSRMDILGVRKYLYKPVTSLRQLSRVVSEELTVAGSK